MSPDIMGVSLDKLEDPIRIALASYQEWSGLKFDRDNACRLVLTPDKPNSARSSTDVLLQEEKVGTLYVIAFKPGDGTGSEDNYQLKDLNVDNPYPTATLVVPRNKTGVHSEAHLTIVSHVMEDSHAEPKLYFGTFDLLGLEGNRVKKIGELGPPDTTVISHRLATLTVGFIGSRRFGDPHAVYSRIPGVVQVCAFLAISDDVNKNHPYILNSLNLPNPPRQLTIK